MGREYDVGFFNVGSAFGLRVRLRSNRSKTGLKEFVDEYSILRLCRELGGWVL
jgi:hypothetical protein